jgi:hypothetical protein
MLVSKIFTMAPQSKTATWHLALEPLLIRLQSPCDELEEEQSSAATVRHGALDRRYVKLRLGCGDGAHWRMQAFVKRWEWSQLWAAA